jgi:ubiquinone/menaquinone biosynthesis C-methylase UbiE
MGNDPYRFWARFYDRLFEPTNRALWAKGLAMHPPEAGASVLDVGCGTGTQLALYRDHGCHISGIDPSPAMLRVASERLGAGADLRLGDATRMPFSDGSFDLALTTLVLHEMRPAVRAATVREVKRVLKPEGRYLVIDFHAGPPRRSLKGLASRAFILTSEIGAGREHFGNYRQFVGSGGVPRVAAANGLSVEHQRIVAGDNMGIYLLGASNV